MATRKLQGPNRHIEIAAKATTAITTNPTAGQVGGGLFVVLDTDPNYFRVCTAGEDPDGVVDTNVLANGVATLKGCGIVQIRLGDTVAAKAYVQSDSTGRAVTATGLVPIAGQVLQGGVVGDFVDLIFRKQPTVGQTGAGSGSLVTNAYSWTNAQVVALGASLTGDITMVTLPAKTQVVDAQIVILTAAAGTTTLTVAAGRTGAAYIDYIVASDAQAAANTVYGDASAERGTNLTGYDIPSYTGTTAVKCHFISTVSNLSSVTTSTGKLILTTRLLP